MGRFLTTLVEQVPSEFIECQSLLVSATSLSEFLARPYVSDEIVISGHRTDVDAIFYGLVNRFGLWA